MSAFPLGSETGKPITSFGQNVSDRFRFIFPVNELDVESVYIGMEKIRRTTGMYSRIYKPVFFVPIVQYRLGHHSLDYEYLDSPNLTPPIMFEEEDTKWILDTFDAMQNLLEERDESKFTFKYAEYQLPVLRRIRYGRIDTTYGEYGGFPRRAGTPRHAAGRHHQYSI